MGMRSDGIETRKRILDAAVTVFSDKGFRVATIGDICRAARTNTASVNYYFGGKGALYVEVWRLAFHRSLEAHPPAGGVPTEAPPAERLRGRILAFVRRIADPDSHDCRIIQREMATPTGLLANVIRDSITPLRRDLDATLRELLGKRASERQVRLCGTAIMAQCLGLLIQLRHRRRFAAKSAADPQAADSTIEEMADHITRFTLAGVGELRRQMEAGARHRKLSATSDRRALS
jgi:AcrR family transcriptional regulator